jgi:eukaryotic-like serine/threonine-protein kinase
MPLTTGARIGPYEIGALLGAGGMGEVFRAHDTRLSRDVAIKTLPDALVADPERVARFEREAQLLAALNHPHIDGIYGLEDAGGSRVLVLEFVDGESLAQRLTSGRIPVDEALGIARQIIDALEAAHEKGIVHRDLKPANIMLAADGRVKVLDFGLAKRFPEQGRSGTLPDLDLTASGMVVGTPSYLPPEVLRGEPADARSDIWALGVVLYEMASGKLPFDGSTFGELQEAILGGAPTPLSGRVPIGIQAVIGRCLAKDPSHRYRQASEARAAIEALIGASSPRGAIASRRAWIPAAGVAAVVLAGAIAVGTGLLRNPLVRGGDHPRIRSLAVLPLANLSRDPEQEYFADGMTEELITDLASIQSLKVTSRTSTMRFKQSKATLREIAGALGVDAIVEGSVQRAGDRVRITAQLIEASSDRHLWARSFERDFQDVLALQSEVARAIAQEIEMQVSPRVSARLASRRPVNPEAYELYLKGRFEWAKLTDAHIRKSIEYFERALAIDPADARYSSGLADAYVVLAQVIGSIPPQEGMKKVEDYSRRALAADENSAEAHTSMAAALFFGDWDAVEAERHIQRAIELNPSYSTAHLVYSVLLATAGRLDEAIEQDRIAIELDPFSLIIRWNASGTLFLARRYQEALAQANRALEIEPGSLRVWLGGVLRINEQMGNYEAALDVLDKYLPEEDGGKTQAARMRQAYAAGGPAGYWKAALEHTLAQAKGGGADPVQLAFFYTHLGEYSRAIDQLERAYGEHSSDVPFMNVQPSFDPLRGDPRFQALVRRIRPRLLPSKGG